MNKDQVEGKVKDIAGRVQRQAGEWSDDPEQQLKGTAKQAEGKVQNAWGKGKDAAKDAADKSDSSAKPSRSIRNDEVETEESVTRRRTGTE
jgi:uncharacterized protein YjbJ (UPF0337 family)